MVKWEGGDGDIDLLNNTRGVRTTNDIFNNYSTRPHRILADK